MSWYCDSAPGHPVHGDYHDHEYGMPSGDETVLFERLCLEIMQAGLSWETILKRRAGMVVAFDGFVVDRVAAYREGDVERLLVDSRIIRNRKKVVAIITNAQRVRDMRAQGGFAAWLAAAHPLTKSAWIRLFKRTFLFTGGEITGEFLMSLGYLPGAHRDNCPAFARCCAFDPPWMTAAARGFVYRDEH